MKPGLSDTKRCIIEFDATKNAIVKIDSRLPEDAKIVTGVFFSLNHRYNPRVKGIIHVRFSEGISSPVMRQKVLTMLARTKRKTAFIPLHEPVSPASTLQGYYVDNSTIAVSYKVKIYIEYLPHDSK